MKSAIVLYILFQSGFLIIAIISSIIWDKRYRGKHASKVLPGFEKTQEITVDPKSGKKLRVYYNPKTGERSYHEETWDIPKILR